MATESELLKALAEVFGARAHERLLVGIGDDAAVVAIPPVRGGAKALLASDMAVEGVHFNREWSTLFEIGAKITAANLADVYAMGGTPDFLLVSAAVPVNFTVAQARELAQGIVDEASKVGAVVVGGDLARSQNMVISIAVMGSVKDPILRSGARVGDLVIISDLPGKSAAGLRLLESGGMPSGRVQDESDKSNDLISAHKRPIVNYQAARSFALAGVSAMSDVSDGLISELAHIARASGVGIEISSDEEIDYHGGEDHIFVATISPHLPFPREAIEIGRVVLGKSVRVNGDVMTHKGFTHFQVDSE